MNKNLFTTKFWGFKSLERETLSSLNDIESVYVIDVQSDCDYLEPMEFKNAKTDKNEVDEND